MKLADVPNIVLVASGKGGVGKTTVSSDIARTAAREGHTVGLIDADISTPNSLQVVGGEDVDISDQRLSTSDAITPPVVNGVQVISQGMVLPDDVPVLRGGTWRAQEVVDFIRNAEWDDDTDLIVIDTPPGTGEELQVIASEAPVTKAYVVTTPHPSAIRDATKTHEFFEQADIPHEAVMNMAYIDPDTIADHIFDSVDLTDVEQVGDARAQDIQNLVRSNAEDFPLFGYEEDSESNVPSTVAATVPYTMNFDARADVYDELLDDLLAATEVEA